jgi:predicted ATP-grasp superfamily ATP-dependent carboligase
MAESAALAGYAVWSLDAFGDLDQHPNVLAMSLPRDVGVPFTVDALVRAAERIETDVVAYLSPFENHPAAVERLARGRTLWGNSASVLRRVREPGVVSRAADVSNADRWLIKPRASGGGHGIEWWSPGNPVPAGSHVEPFIDGEPGSIVFVAAGREIAPLGLTSQIVGDPSFGATGFRYCGRGSESGRQCVPQEAYQLARTARSTCASRSFSEEPVNFHAGSATCERLCCGVPLSSYGDRFCIHL